jgi:uncharacterized protein (TIGR00369 family)
VKPTTNQIPSHFLPTYDGCYVCGQTHPRGLRIRFFTGDFGQVCAHLRLDHTLTEHKHVVHGSVISAFLEELLAWPIALQTGRMAAAAEISVRYLKPMLAGDTYLAVALPGENCTSHWKGSGEIRDEQGTTYASARGKYILRSAVETAKIAQNLRYQPGDPPVFHYHQFRKTAFLKIEASHENSKH